MFFICVNVSSLSFFFPFCSFNAFLFSLSDEGITMATFVKLKEGHLKDLGFRMGDRVLLIEWIASNSSSGTDMSATELSTPVSMPVPSTSSAASSVNQPAVSF